jgi:hypothetical protein
VSAPLGERQLQRAVEQLLEVLRQSGRIVEWYHRPDRPAGRRERGGLPDLVIGLDFGRVAALELKGPRGKTTEAQEAWLRCFFPRAAVCRSLDEVQERLAAWGVM